MVKSKAKIEKQLKRKKNSELVKTIIAAKKKENWLKIAEILSGSRKNRKDINLEKLDEESIDGKTIIIPGKVLSQGNIRKKIKIAALGFSEKAKEKLLKAKCEVSGILEEIKKNPQAKGVRILK